MSLNQIKLTNPMIAGLYQDVLVETNTSIAMPGPADLKVLGKNNKHILLIVNNAGVPFLPDSELSFLTNILQACQLSLADVAIVNLAGSGAADLNAIFEKVSARTVIFFGLSSVEMGLPMAFPDFQIQKFNERVYLTSPTLSKLEADKTMKMQLWNALKTLFKL